MCCLNVLVPQQPVLPLGVPILQKSVKPLDMSDPLQFVLYMDASVIQRVTVVQRIVLQMDISVLQQFVPSREVPVLQQHMLLLDF
jgi:hypothetical protein